MLDKEGELGQERGREGVFVDGWAPVDNEIYEHDRHTSIQVSRGCVR